MFGARPLENVLIAAAHFGAPQGGRSARALLK
jgi:hypothetical protein